jgi:alpha-L-fucosidase
MSLSRRQFVHRGEGGRLTIRSLAAGSPHTPGSVERVELVGASAPLEHTRDAEGLHVRLPERRPGEYVFAFEISGSGLVRA